MEQEDNKPSPEMETTVWILTKTEAGSLRDKSSCGTGSVDTQLEDELDDPGPAGGNGNYFHHFVLNVTRWKDFPLRLTTFLK